MEVLFIYNSNQIKEREAFGYANALNTFTLNECDIYKNPLTRKQIADLAKKIGGQVSELIDENSEIYLDAIKDKEFEDDDLLLLMEKHPELLQTPILETKEKAYYLSSPFDMNATEMAFNEIKTELSNKDEN